MQGIFRTLLGTWHVHDLWSMRWRDARVPPRPRLGTLPGSTTVTCARHASVLRVMAGSSGPDGQSMGLCLQLGCCVIETVTNPERLEGHA